MRIAVTGGAGFLGFHLAQSLQGRDGWSVRLLDVEEPPADDFDPPIDFRRVDVRDATGMRAAAARG